jgi:hypothetical protein
MTQPCPAQPPTHTHCTNTSGNASHITTTYTGMMTSTDPVEKKRRTDNAKFAKAIMAKSSVPQCPMNPSRSSGSAGASGSADPPPQQPAMQHVGHDNLTKKYLEKHKNSARRPMMVASKSKQQSLLRLISSGVGLNPGSNSCGNMVDHMVDQKGAGHVVDHGTYLFGTHTLEFRFEIYISKLRICNSNSYQPPHPPPPPPLQSGTT